MKPNHLTARRRARLYLPAVEPLESRISPATVVSVTGGALQVQDAGTTNHALTVGVNASSYRFTDPNGITAGAGAIQVDGNTVDVIMGSVTGPADIHFGAGADAVTFAATLTFAGSLMVDTGTGADSVAVNAALTVNGDFTVNTPGALTVANSISVGASMTANIGTSIQFSTTNSSVAATGSGTVMLNSMGDMVFNAGSNISTMAGDVTLASDAMDLGGSISTPAAATVTLHPITPGVGIDVGSVANPVGGPLSLSDAELDHVTTSNLVIGGIGSGMLTVSGDITLSTVANLTLAAGTTSNVRFAGLGRVDTGAGAVTLIGGGGIDSGAIPVEVICGALSLSTNGGAVGASANPFGFDATSLTAISNGLPAGLYLAEANTTTISNLDASIGSIFLVSGTFVAGGANAISASSNLGLDGTLDLNGTSVSVAILGSLNGSTGIVTNSAISPGSLTCNVGLGTTSAFLGKIQDGIGTVQFTKLGAGTEVLSGGNGYSGGTSVGAGKLRLLETPTGQPGTGPISIGAGATFVYDHTANFTLPNALSGAGTFEKVGSGTLALAGANTMIGSILITAGTLQVGNGGSLGSLGTASVTNNAGLAFNHIDNISVTNDISGPGGLHVLGGGVVSLTGSNTYTGVTTIDTGATLELASISAALDSPLTLNGGTVQYNLGGTQTAHPTVTLNANSSVGVAGGSRVDWSGNSMTGGSFNLTKTGAGVLSHDDAVWAAKQTLIQDGALAATGSVAFGTTPIDVSQGAAFWIEGALTIPNGFTLRGDGGGVSGPGVTPTGALVTSAPGGGGAATLTGAINVALPSEIDTATTDLLLSGQITGSGTLTKTGPHTLILGNKNNTFGVDGSTNVTVADGVLQVATDKALGAAGNGLVFTTGGGLRTTAGFITTRHITATNNTTFDVTGRLQLLGTIDGAGIISKAGTGSIVFGAGFTGTTTVDGSSGAVSVGPAKIAVTGAGSVQITVVDDGLGGKKIDSLVLSDTTAATKIVLKGPSGIGATLQIDHITSTDAADEILSLTLRKGVILGDGVADAIPDIELAGKIGKLILDTISPNALIRLGTGLTYNNPGDDTSPDTYNNHPDFIATNVGPGTIIDVTGDGLPAGTGGGGLGRVNIKSWPGAGTIRTTQSITSFLLRSGDCNIVFEVDKNHTGANTVADVGMMLITHGAWGSVGTDIEGAVGNFSASSFLAGATINAGNFLHFSVKSGALAGTVTLAKADDARVGNFTVNGDFTGIIEAAEAIKNLNIKGDFHGTLSAKAIASITAYTFDGSAIGDTFGDATKLNIVAREGSLGTLKAKAGLIKNYDISVATIFNGFNVPKVTGVPPVETGVKNVSVYAGQINGLTSAYDVSDSLFVSATTIAKVMVGAAALNANVVNTKILAGVALGDDLALGGTLTAADTMTMASVTNFKVYGNVTTGSFVGAGVNPVDGIFGNADDLVVGGLNSKMPTFAVTGSVSADSHFTAGLFKKPKIANVVINPLVDVRFTVG